MRRQLTCALVAATTLVLGMASGAGAQTVTNAQLQKGLADPGTWLNYGGDYGSQRHSPLTQITPANVDAALGRSGRSRPTRSASSSRRRWCVQRHHVRHRAEQHGVGRRRAHRPADLALPPRPARRTSTVVLRPRQSRLRGARRHALHDTLDAHLLALDMKTGAVVWDSTSSTTTRPGYSGDARAARRQGQGDRRHRRRRVRHPRLHRRLRRGRPASARGASGRFPGPA